MDTTASRPTEPARAARGNWLRRYGVPSDAAEATLVCLPHAGGAPTFFRDWPGLLSPAIDVVSVCYPGRQDRFDEPCITRMSDMAEELAAVLAPLAHRRPVALFGHSMGAAVGYETARLLRARHRIRLSHLFASGMVPPHRIPRGVRHLKRDDALVADLVEQGGTDAEVLADEELRALVLPAVRADYHLLETYRHVAGGEALDTPIVAYYGQQDPRVPAAAVREWQRYTRMTSETKSFPGGHFYLQEVKETLIADLRARILAQA